MNKETDLMIQCAYCDKQACRGTKSLEGPDNCPTKTRAGVVKKTKSRYHEPGLAEFARMASVVEGAAYTRVPWAGTQTPLTTRLEEIIRLSKKMGYHKLGLAFCIGLSNEAKVLTSLLDNAGFKVVSVCCKTGGIPKEEIGIKDREKINPGQHESMCNPIAQAEILNKEKCDFNVMLGLCVGHDSLFLKHARAMTTVFAVKDRLLGHNPLAAIYLSQSYYRRLCSPDIAAKL